jgi:hypothetical protein
LNSLKKVSESDEIQKILKENPKWITKLNIIVFLVVIAIISFISLYIKYPIIISTMITIISVNEDGNIYGEITITNDKLYLINPGNTVKLNLQFDNWETTDLPEYTIVEFSKEYNNENNNVIILKASKNLKENRNIEKLKSLIKTKVHIEIITKEVPLIKKLLENVKIILSVV